MQVRYPRDVVCRGDRRGVVHLTIRPTLALYDGASQPTPPLCEQLVNGLAVMTLGPLEDYPTCLWCILRSR
jgi:hypothetical protein